MSATLFPMPLPPRWLVYSSRKKREPMCVAAARSEGHALRIARQHGLPVTRHAYAVLEKGAKL